MKTLKIALASALIILSFNSFAETCYPCTTSGNLRADSAMVINEDMPQDSQVNNLLQQMTSVAHSQLLNVSAISAKSHKHDRKKASN